jgi:L-fuconolactonase
LIVDSHCHASTCWYEPLESLLHQMDRNNVERAILIQIKGQTDNSYQQECMRRYPERFASVVLVDAGSSSGAGDLRRLAGEGATGVRLAATTRSPGSDPLLIWRVAEELGLAVSCSGTAHEFASEEFARLVETFPGLPIVLEHLAASNRPDASDEERSDRLRAFTLARFPNAYMKIHGLGEFATRAMPVTEPFPFEEPIPDLLEQVYQAFGARRMMWGSDFPPVSSREGYTNALQLTMQRLGSLTSEERDLIFSQVALSVFPIRG